MRIFIATALTVAIIAALALGSNGLHRDEAWFLGIVSSVVVSALFAEWTSP